MQAFRAITATLLGLTLAVPASWGGPANSLGTVVAAERAHVGEAAAAVGTTVYNGDRISTEEQGNVQIRAGAARLLLSSRSSAIINDSEGAASAKLLSGSATFSTANANAFTLYAESADIRPTSNAPTIGRVTYISPKEVVVMATRGELLVSLFGESQVIPEGKAYQVSLDPPEAAQGPSGAGSGKGSGGRGGGSPLKAGRSRFLLVVGVITGVATYFAVEESLESAKRP